METLERRILLSTITGVSDPFSVTDRLVFTTNPPAMIEGGAPLTLTVQAQDGAGVLDTSFNGTVTLSDHYTRYYNGSLNGTLTVKAVNGIATFTNVSQEFPTSQTVWDEGDVFYADSGLLPEANSSAMDIYHDQLAFLTQPPTNTTAGSPFDVEVEAVDSAGNLDTSFSGTVVLSDHYSANGGTRDGQLTVKAVNGVATFTGVSQEMATDPTNTDIGNDMLYAFGYDEGMPNAFSREFSISPAAASQLVFANGPFDSTNASVVNAPLSFQVNAEDAFGNLATEFNGDISLALGDNPGSATLGGTTTVAAQNGVATFSDVTINSSGDGYTIVASGAGTATSSPFSLLDQLVFTTEPPANVIAGAPFTVVVKAEDGTGHVDTSFNGSITILDDYGEELNHEIAGVTTVNAVNGVATFSDLVQTLTTDEYGYGPDQLGTRSNEIDASSTDFGVVASDANMLVFSKEPPATVAVNSPFSVVVEAHDATGQVDTSFNGIVNLDQNPNSPISQQSLSGSTIARAVDGVATFTGIFENSTTDSELGQTDTLTAAADGFGDGNSNAFSVKAADQLVFTTQPSSIDSEDPFSIAVTAEDASGNVDSSFNGLVTLSDSYSTKYADASLKGTLTVNAVAGVATFNDLSQSFPSDLAAGNEPDYFYATASGRTPGASAGFTIEDVQTSQRLVFLTQPPATIQAGSAFSVSIAAEDASGNLIHSFNGTVVLNSDGASRVDAVNGVATFNDVSINQAGLTSLTAALDSSGQQAQSNTFVVTPGPVTQLVFNGTGAPVDANDDSGIAKVATPLAVAVQAEDAFNNIVDTYNGNVTLTLSTNPSGASLSGATTVAAVDGIATFDDFTVDQAGSGFTLNASGPASGASQGFDVAGDQLVFVTQPPTIVKAGTSFNVVVAAEDRQGNVDPAFNGEVNIMDKYFFSNVDDGFYGMNGQAVDGLATFTITVPQAVGGRKSHRREPRRNNLDQHDQWLCDVHRSHDQRRRRWIHADRKCTGNRSGVSRGAVDLGACSVFELIRHSSEGFVVVSVSNAGASGLRAASAVASATSLVQKAVPRLISRHLVFFPTRATMADSNVPKSS